MSVSQTPNKCKGLSFSIAELTLVRAWAQANSLRMVVRLDHGSEVEEFEEVLAFHAGKRSPCQWIMWRDATVVFIQPLIGRTERFDTVAAAFESRAARQPTWTGVTAATQPE